MKYDIAKNEDGPLRKTLLGRKGISTATPEGGPEQDYDHAGRISGLDERLRNIETHLAVRYGQLAVGTPSFRTVTGTCSSISAEVLIGSYEVPRGSHRSIRKRVPTLGCPALQSTSSGCTLTYLPSGTRPTLLTLRVYSGHLRLGQRLLLSLLTSRLPHLKVHIQGHCTTTPRRQPLKLRRGQYPSLEVNCPSLPLRRARESPAGPNQASIVRSWRNWKYRGRYTTSLGPAKAEPVLDLPLHHCAFPHLRSIHRCVHN